MLVRTCAREDDAQNGEVSAARAKTPSPANRGAGSQGATHAAQRGAARGHGRGRRACGRERGAQRRPRVHNVLVTRSVGGAGRTAEGGSSPRHQMPAVVERKDCVRRCKVTEMHGTKHEGTFHLILRLTHIKDHVGAHIRARHFRKCHAGGDRYLRADYGHRSRIATLAALCARQRDPLAGRSSRPRSALGRLLQGPPDMRSLRAGPLGGATRCGSVWPRT